MVHILPAAPLGTTDQMSPIRAAVPRKKKDIEDEFAEVMAIHASLLADDRLWVDETQAEYRAPMLVVLAGLARRRVIPPEVCEALLDPLDHAEIG